MGFQLFETENILQIVSLFIIHKTASRSVDLFHFRQSVVRPKLLLLLLCFCYTVTTTVHRPRSTAQTGNDDQLGPSPPRFRQLARPDVYF